MIIGAGVVGCSIARELSRYNLDLCVLDKEEDAACVTSKANSGIVHAGYDAEPGSCKALFNARGQRMFEKLSRELDFPFKRCGSIVLGFKEDDIAVLNSLMERGTKNGLDDLRIIGKEELSLIEPNISENAVAALLAPSGGIVSPYEMTIALAENATQNGVKFFFGAKVQSLEKLSGRSGGEFFRAKTSKGCFESKIVINAAGLFADEINNMLSAIKFKVIPRKGEYCLLDSSEAGLVSHTVFQTPGPMGKGVLATQTADGNILLGPTSKDVLDKEDFSTTSDGLSEVLAKASRSLKKIPTDKIITSFAGLRAHVESDDFIAGESEDVKGLINFIGIESPGLSAAPALGEKAAQIACAILSPPRKHSFNPFRPKTPRFRELSNQERQALIEGDPNYGKIICRCEKVSKAEILAALRSPLKPSSLDAIKRRTRVGMGRCQSGFCMMKLVGIISEELGASPDAVTKFGGASTLLVCRNKSELKEEFE
jgi:glycerol-3-phosphate dehydrogenase